MSETNITQNSLGLSPKNSMKLKSFFFDLVINLSIIVALAVVIRVFLIEPFNVQGSSMCDTLNFVNGQCVNSEERIIVNKLSYAEPLGINFGDPQRNDIVVFLPPQGKDESYIKRIIGLPGETLELRDGQVIISNSAQPEGFVLDEPYLNEKNAGKTFAMAGVSKFTMAENEYFVMGDNRAASSDSRVCFRVSSTCQPGDRRAITKDDIKGKAWISIWPINKIRFLH